MKHRKEGVEHCIQVFGPDRWENDEFDTLVFFSRVANIVGPPIHRHIVAAGGQSRGKLFGKRFKPAVVRRYAPRAENGQLHRGGL